MSSPQNTIVCYGEILWDLFPSGSKPGGAPLNVAYHLKKLGMDAQIISRVGRDALGEKLLSLIRQWGISTEWCQIDDRYDTGTVVPKVDENREVKYDVLEPVAWDFIGWRDNYESLIKNAKAFVFQSLSARNQVSRKTLYTMLETAPYKVFDINLRPPFYTLQLIKDLAKKSDLVKMNRSEFRQLLSWLDRPALSEIDGVHFLQETFHIKETLITKDSEGASYHSAQHNYEVPAVAVAVKDPVGCGDAFLAAFLAKTLMNASLESAMAHAAALGAFITTQEGACPDYSLSDLENFKMEKTPKSSPP